MLFNCSANVVYFGWTDNETRVLKLHKFAPFDLDKPGACMARTSRADRETSEEWAHRPDELSHVSRNDQSSAYDEDVPGPTNEADEEEFANDGRLL